MSLAPDVRNFRNHLSEQEQKIFDTVVSIAENVNPFFQSRLQWQKLIFTLDGNWHHWIFSLSKTKAGMTTAFHKGWLLGLIAGIVWLITWYAPLPSLADLLLVCVTCGVWRSPGISAMKRN